MFLKYTSSPLIPPPQEVISNKQRPSNIEAEVFRIANAEAPSILGQIHFDLAKYHEVGALWLTGLNGAG